MSSRSRCDAYLAIYLDFPRVAGQAIPKPVNELMEFEEALTSFIQNYGFHGFKVRAMKFTPKEGRYIGVLEEGQADE